MVGQSPGAWVDKGARRLQPQASTPIKYAPSTERRFKRYPGGQRSLVVGSCSRNSPTTSPRSTQNSQLPSCAEGQANLHFYSSFTMPAISHTCCWCRCWTPYYWSALFLIIAHLVEVKIECRWNCWYATDSEWSRSHLLKCWTFL